MIKEIVVERAPVPEGLLRCAAEPPPPADPNDVETVATHYLDVAVAGRDCRAKLGAVRQLVLPTPTAGGDLRRGDTDQPSVKP